MPKRPPPGHASRCSLSYRALPGSPGTLLLLHGMLASHHYFSRAFSGADLGWRLLLPDLLGHGESDKPDLAYTVEEHLAPLRDLLDREADSGPVVLGGHSLGAALAVALAAALPEGRVSGLILLNLPWFSSPTLLHDTLRSGSSHYKEATDGLSAAGDEEILRLSGEAVQDFVRLLPPALKSEAKLPSPAALAGTARNCLFGFRLDQHMDLVRGLPMLLVHGDQDIVAPAKLTQERLSSLPRAKWVLLEGAGHHLLYTHTARVAGEIAAYLSQIADGQV